MNDNLADQRFHSVFNRYQSATSSEDYIEVLNELSAILDQEESLTPTLRRSCLLFSAKCNESLGRFGDAEQLLKGLLTEIESQPEDETPGLLPSIWLSLADLFRLTSRGKEAITYFTLVTDYFKQSGDWQSEINVYMTIAQLWQEQGRMDLAITNLEAARTASEKHEVGPIHQQVFFALGHCYYLVGNLRSAIDLEEKALALARRFGDSESENHLIQNLAEFTFQTQDFQRALHYVSNRLRDARSRNILDDILRYLSYLGACLTETGQGRKALEVYDELEALLLKHDQQASVLFGMCMLGKAQVLVDLKRHQETQPFLDKARIILEQFDSDTDLLDRIQDRLNRETQSPLSIDCPHRSLQMALAGNSLNVSHSNPQPLINLNDTRFLTSKLSEDDKAHFRELQKELSLDIFQTKYFESGISQVPDSMMLPMKFEYVDDVEEFEIKWAIFKREQSILERLPLLQQQWDQIKDRFRYATSAVIQSSKDKLELFVYIRQLARLAMLYAEVGDRDGVRRVALHASDFIESHTSDPMVAALIWPVRAELMLAAYSVTESRCRELIEIELWRCLIRMGEVFELLDQDRRSVALNESFKTWFEIALKVLGHKGYSGLVKLAGDLYNSLDMENQFRFGIAVGSAGNPDQAVKIMDAILERVRADNPGIRIVLAAEFQRSLATNRFKALCSNYDDCIWHYGPFAPYIHHEVCVWSPDIFPANSRLVETHFTRPRAMAFVDGNLVVIDKRLADLDHVAAMNHEIEHLFFRSGQQLKTDVGEWLQVKRDVPIASALTYLHILEYQAESTIAEIRDKVCMLVDMGRRQIERDTQASQRYIKNTIHYFDDLGTQETSASYPCAAILLGMALELLSSNEAAESYLHHLSIMDHDIALEYGRRKAILKL